MPESANKWQGPEVTGADPAAIMDLCRAFGFPWSEENDAAGFPAPPPLSCFVSGVISAGYGGREGD